MMQQLSASEWISFNPPGEHKAARYHVNNKKPLVKNAKKASPRLQIHSLVTQSYLLDNLHEEPESKSFFPVIHKRCCQKHPDKIALHLTPCSLPCTAPSLTRTVQCPSSASIFQLQWRINAAGYRGCHCIFQCQCSAKPWLQLRVRLSSVFWLSLVEWRRVQVRADSSRSAEGNQCARWVPT